jgi:hypothetical protein
MLTNKRSLLKIIYLTIGIAIFSALIIFSLRDQILRYGTNALIKRINNQNVTVEIKEPNLDNFSIKSKSLNITFMKNLFFIPINLSDLYLKPSYLPILLNSELSGDIKSKAYTGDLDLHYSILWEKNTLNLNGAVNKLQIWKHEQIAALGLASGFLSANLKKLMLSNESKIIETNILLKNLRFPEARNLPSNLTGLPFELEIPPLSVRNAQFDLDYNSNKCLIKNLKIESSLAKIKGNFELINYNSKMLISAADVKITLSKLGKKKYGILLAGFAEPKVDTDTYKISISDGFRKFSIVSIVNP